MILPSLITLLSLGSMATAAPTTRARAAVSRKLLIGGPASIFTANFDGSSFELTPANVTAGTAPSWMRYKGSTKTVYAVDENGSNLNQFKFGDETRQTLIYASSVEGSAGVVFLEFNKDKTRMVGTSYGKGTIDVWDVSTDGPPKSIKTITVDGPLGPNQEVHRPHQARLDPTGRFMVVPDLGGDQLLVLDTKDDKYEITNTVTLFAGAGPRHGGFISSNDKTFYAVACETSNKVIFYEVDYADDKLGLKEISTQSTYGANSPPANATSAAAGALTIANNKHVYISNRLTGNETDSISHFVFDAASSSLNFASSVSSRGILPRAISLSTDKYHNYLFVANQGGDNGLVAFTRCPSSGELTAEPVAVKLNSELIPAGLEGTPNVGPQYVQEI
ncbi:putative isomerase YbhE [Xylaria digitata]|nr:putative isomerase YbhE [Xylaria digitata]